MTAREEIAKAASRVGEDIKKFKASDIMTVLHESVTPEYLSSVLKGLVGDGLLLKEGGGRYTTYILPKHAGLLANSYHGRIKNAGQDEYEVMQGVIHKTHFLQQLKPTTKRIFDYAFTEMLNNSLEHSQSKTIDIEVLKSGNNLVFTISDHGVGAFKNVKKTKSLASEIEAMQEILKGKTTTMPQNHSGEGIFFTSKVSDVFILESYGLKLRVDNLISDVFYEEKSDSVAGTVVTFIVSLDTETNTQGIFMQYTSDPEEGGFDKTSIRVKLYAGGSIYISRSQARRIMDGLGDKFKTIILDFDKVDTVGQAFADEIFRVFKLKHPEVEVSSINENDVIRFMIERVDKPTK